MSTAGSAVTQQFSKMALFAESGVVYLFFQVWLSIYISASTQLTYSRPDRVLRYVCRNRLEEDTC